MKKCNKIMGKEWHKKRSAQTHRRRGKDEREAGTRLEIGKKMKKKVLKRIWRIRKIYPRNITPPMRNTSPQPGETHQQPTIRGNPRAIPASIPSPVSD